MQNTSNKKFYFVLTDLFLAVQNNYKYIQKIWLIFNVVLLSSSNLASFLSPNLNHGLISQKLISHKTWVLRVLFYKYFWLEKFQYRLNQ